jgi:hypothetical protein
VRFIFLVLILLAVPARAQNVVQALAPGQTVIDPDEEGRISGEIVDARSGLPAVGTVVALFHPHGLGDRVWPEPWVPDFPAEDDAPVATVRAAGEGQFLFDGLSPGRYRVSALVGPKAQVTTAWLMVTRERPSAFASLRTNIGGLVAGVVVSERGTPLPEMFVYIAAIDDGEGGNAIAGKRPSLRTLSDEVGRFSLADVPPARVFLQAGRPDRGYSPLMPLEVLEGQDVLGLEVVVPDDSARIEKARASRGGLGIVVDFDARGVRVRKLVPGLPAEAAGLQPGDRILALDGQSTRWMIRFEFFSRALGLVGESITLTVVRGTGAPFDVTIDRALMPER